MEETRRCPRCGEVIRADAPAGQCPCCLMAAAVGRSQGDAGEMEAEVPAGESPFSRAELEAAFPRLEVLEQIGEGGMGVVYKARQRSLDRIVALKIIPRRVARDPAFAERFSREARALARLNHPNIVAVHESGESNGLYYLVMEFVDGVNLRQAQRQGRLSPREALKIVPQICDALQYAHDRGVVHRDIKPENILMDREGGVKIADFGLAKILGGAAGNGSLTRPTQVMGTYHYMAPEQINTPKDVDHRVDIYSLGVVFYEMLTGELPIGRFPPPSRKVDVDVSLDRVVLRALETERERRYQHASEVKSDVSGIRSVEGVARGGKRPDGERGPRAGRPGREVSEVRGSPERGSLSRLVVAGWLMYPTSIMLGVVSYGLGLYQSSAIAVGVCGGIVGVILCLMGVTSIRANSGLRGRGLGLAGGIMPLVGGVLFAGFAMLLLSRQRSEAARETALMRMKITEQMQAENVEVIPPGSADALREAAVRDLLRRLDQAGEDRAARATLVDPARRDWFLSLPDGEFARLRSRGELGLAGIDLEELAAPLDRFDMVFSGQDEMRGLTVRIENEGVGLAFPAIRTKGGWFLAIGPLVRDPP